MVPYVVAPLARESFLPISTVPLEGRQVPAPAEPEALLEATYGSDWRVPDPSFKYQPERSTNRRFRGLFGGDRLHVNYWDGFYATKADKVPSEPSAFARWVAERDDPPSSLVDIGSGTGRDALWLASQGIEVLGCDYSPVAVRYASAHAEERGCSATFRQLDLYDLREMLSVGALLGHEATRDAVYARFLVHALEDAGRLNLWRFSRSVLSRTAGRVFLEFRTEATTHEFGEHFRHFVDAEVVCSELTSYGFDIEHCEDRHGLAVYKGEDPRVCRIVARLRG
jgi:SAM-dependent methyltransferase